MRRASKVTHTAPQGFWSLYQEQKCKVCICFIRKTQFYSHFRKSMLGCRVRGSREPNLEAAVMGQVGHEVSWVKSWCQRKHKPKWGPRYLSSMRKESSREPRWPAGQLSLCCPEGSRLLIGPLGMFKNFSLGGLQLTGFFLETIELIPYLGGRPEWGQ